MKIKFWLFFASLFTLALTSCSDDNDDPITYAPPAVYTGTYTVDQVPAQGSLAYSLFIEPDGTVVTESRGGNGSWYYSAGTWTLTGDTLRTDLLTINFPGQTVGQTQKYVFSTSTGQLTQGTWKDGINGSNYTGKFQNMTRAD